MLKQALLLFLCLVVYPTIAQDLTVTAPDPICAGESATIGASAGGLISYSINGVEVGEGESFTRVYNATTLVEVSARVLQDNIITNPGFESGNSGFTSDYFLATGNIPQGAYGIETNANNSNPQWFLQLSDHTSGSGNMMTVDGGSQSGAVVYRTQVNVQTDIEYIFSAWIANIHVNLENPPILEFYINGQSLGEINAQAEPGWEEFYTTWVSNTTGPISIELRNTNTEFGGNDFALDDLVFAQLEPQTETVTVQVNPIPVAVASADPDQLCDGQSTQLQANTGMDSYAWTPSTGLSDDAIQNPTVTPNATTRYTVEVTRNGCSDTASVNVVVGNLLDVDAGPDVTICADGSVQLQATGGEVYEWSPSESLDDANIANPLASPTLTTEYTVSATSAAGCSGSDAIVVTVETDQDLGLPTTISICELSDDSVLAAPPVVGEWSGTGVADVLTGLFSPTTAGVGDFEVTFDPTASCITPVTIDVAVTASTPVDLLVQDSELCQEDDPITLAAQADGIWTGDGVEQSGVAQFNPLGLVADNYPVVFVPDAYCYAPQTVNMTVKQSPDATITDANFCLGQGEVALEVVTPGGMWSGDKGISGAGTLNPDEMGLGTYTANYEIAIDGCFDSDEMVFQISSIGVDIGPDTALCGLSGKTVVMADAIEEAATYEWNTGSDNSYLSTSSSGIYRVTATDAFGCTASDTVFVEDLCPCELYIPNSFSPNGDEYNEVFRPKGRYELAYEMEIYSRWGTLIFSSDHIDDGWDGTIDGELAPVGVYAVKIQCPVGGDYTGRVSLIR